jgi:hypothetical protein
MKKLQAASLLIVGVTLLATAGQAGAFAFNKSNYSGRIACDGGLFSTASWVVVPDGKGGYHAGVQCANVEAPSAGPCQYIFSLDTAKSNYSVDSFGIVHEELDWLATSQGTLPAPGNYTDHVGGALFGGGGLFFSTGLTLGGSFTGTNFTDDNLVNQGLTSFGSCNY